MKKLLSVLLAVVCILSLAACASSQPQSATEAETAGDSNTPVTGGWTLNSSDAATLPKDVQTAFDKATEAITGGRYVPVAYLGSQVVAGMNYALLCELLPATTPSPASVEDTSPFSLKVLIIYSDLGGKAEITNVADFDLAKYTQDGGKTQTELLSGGWSAPEELSSAPIDDGAKAAFSKAMENFEGNNLDLMALLGTQVVSGTNYAFLCRSTPVTPDAASSIQVVTVYEDLDKNATIFNICRLDVADFNS